MQSIKWYEVTATYRTVNNSSKNNTQIKYSKSITKCLPLLKTKMVAEFNSVGIHSTNDTQNCFTLEISITVVTVPTTL